MKSIFLLILFSSCTYKHQFEIDELSDTIFREGKGRGIEIQVLPIQPAK